MHTLVVGVLSGLVGYAVGKGAFDDDRKKNPPPPPPKPLPWSQR